MGVQNLAVDLMNPMISDPHPIKASKGQEEISTGEGIGKLGCVNESGHQGLQGLAPQRTGAILYQFLAELLPDVPSWPK